MRSQGCMSSDPVASETQRKPKRKRIGPPTAKRRGWNASGTVGSRGSNHVIRSQPHSLHSQLSFPLVDCIWGHVLSGWWPLKLQVYVLPAEELQKKADAHGFSQSRGADAGAVARWAWEVACAGRGAQPQVGWGGGLEFSQSETEVLLWAEDGEMASWQMPILLNRFILKSAIKRRHLTLWTLMSTSENERLYHISLTSFPAVKNWCKKNINVSILIILIYFFFSRKRLKTEPYWPRILFEGKMAWNITAKKSFPLAECQLLSFGHLSGHASDLPRRRGRNKDGE